VKNQESQKEVQSEIQSENFFEFQETTLPEPPQAIPARKQLSEDVIEPFIKYSRIPCGTYENLKNTNDAIQGAFEMIKELGRKKSARAWHRI